MSTVVASSIVADAALAVGDPGMKRVTPPEWLLFYNRACRTMARRMRILEFQSRFDIVTDHLYSDPDDLVRIKWIRYSATPSDETTMYYLEEIFEDEYRDRTHRHRETGDPRYYFARQGYFHLVPMPSAAVPQGAQLAYWGTPADATSSSQTIPFADFIRDVILEGMILYAQLKLEKTAAAEQALRAWADTIARDRDTIEDRSADRRQQLRPMSTKLGYLNQR